MSMSFLSTVTIEVDSTGYTMEMLFPLTHLEELFLRRHTQLSIQHDKLLILGKAGRVKVFNAGIHCQQAVQITMNSLSKAELCAVLVFLDAEDVASIGLDVSPFNEPKNVEIWCLPEVVPHDEDYCSCGGILMVQDETEAAFEQEEFRCKGCSTSHYKMGEANGVLPEKSGDDCPSCGWDVKSERVPGFYKPGHLICPNCLEHWAV